MRFSKTSEIVAAILAASICSAAGPQRKLPVAPVSITVAAPSSVSFAAALLGRPHATKDVSFVLRFVNRSKKTIKLAPSSFHWAVITEKGKILVEVGEPSTSAATPHELKPGAELDQIHTAHLTVAKYKTKTEYRLLAGDFGQTGRTKFTIRIGG